MNATIRRAMESHNQLGFDWGKTSIKLKDLANSGFGILSQVIAGKQGTQVAVNSGGQLVPVNPQQGAYQYGANPYTTQQNPYPQNPYPDGGAGQNVVKAGSGVLDGIASSFGVSTGTLTIFGALGFALYLMQPGSKRR